MTTPFLQAIVNELTLGAVEVRSRLGPASALKLEVTAHAVGDKANIDVLFSVLVRRDKKMVKIGSGQSPEAAIHNAEVALRGGA